MGRPTHVCRCSTRPRRKVSSSCATRSNKRYAFSRMREWVPQQKRREVLQAPIGAASPSPGMQVVERPGWYQVVRPDTRDTSSSEVIVSELEADDAERVIDETLAFHVSLGLRFK